MATRDPQFRHALAAYAAFKPADLPEAQQRVPASDLQGYAQARGLEYLGSRNPMGYWGVVPADERLQFNVVRGVLPGGRHGILFHNLREVALWYHLEFQHWHAVIGAELHGLTIDAEAVPFDPKDLLKLAPVVGMFVDDSDKRPAVAGIPITVAATLVPQVAALPPFQFVNHDNATSVEKVFNWENRIDLRSYGFESMWAEGPAAPTPDAELVARLMTTPFYDVLRTLAPRAYLQIKLDHGQLALGVDGYIGQDGLLDVLGEALANVAGAIADAARPMHQPQPFGEPLPEADWPRRHTADQILRAPSVFPPQPYVEGMLAGAEKRGWIPEDSTAYHLAFPDLPVPGTAFAVMRFTPPGSSTIGRVAWHAERPMSRYNIGRNAVLLPSGAAPTPPGGVRRADLNLHYAIADGLLCAWRGRDQDPIHTMVGMEAVVNDTLALARAEGLAQV